MSKYKVGDMIVGYRFKADVRRVYDPAVGLKLRPGLGGTVVIDQEILSGPIYLCATADQLYAKCYNCLEKSRYYKIMHVGLTRWAHNHRCPKREVMTH